MGSFWRIIRVAGLRVSAHASAIPRVVLALGPCPSAFLPFNRPLVPSLTRRATNCGSSMVTLRPETLTQARCEENSNKDELTRARSLHILRRLPYQYQRARTERKSFVSYSRHNNNPNLLQVHLLIHITSNLSRSLSPSTPSRANHHHLNEYLSASAVRTSRDSGWIPTSFIPAGRYRDTSRRPPLCSRLHLISWRHSRLCHWSTRSIRLHCILFPSCSISQPRLDPLHPEARRSPT